MDADDRPRISDPVRIRALTHPLRLELLEVLGDGPATATQCAELTGESVASCSFHLRMLAKYGFVEAGDRRGREKPWQLTSPSREIRPDHRDPDSVRAVEAMAQLSVEHAVENTRSWLSQVSHETEEWNLASTISTSSVWATVDELEALSRTVQELTGPFASRNQNPADRPPGARPIHLFATAHVDVERERRDRRNAT
jgi:hypothetical protein